MRVSGALAFPQELERCGGVVDVLFAIVQDFDFSSAEKGGPEKYPRDRAFLLRGLRAGISLHFRAASRLPRASCETGKSAPLVSSMCSA